MKLLPLLALFFASCIGPPDRATIETGFGDGSFESPSGRDWDDNTSWVAFGLEFPITYSRPPRPALELPPPVVIYVPTPAPLVAMTPPAVPAPAPAAPAPAPEPDPKPAPAQAAIAGTKGKWWEDFQLVQLLVVALGGAIAAKYGKPAYEQVREYVKKPRRAKAAAKPPAASTKPPVG
jgi:hypothetical protein